MTKIHEAVSQIILRASTHRYGLVNRPPSIGSVPKGYIGHDPSNEGIDGVRHGVLTYDRELTVAEVKQYELLPLDGKTGRPLEVQKFPQAVIRKAEEAIATLVYVHDEHLDKEDESVKEEIEKANKTLDIFRSYARSKGLNADAALAELGYDATYHSV